MSEALIVQYLNQLGSGTILDAIAVVVSFIPFLVLVWLALGMMALRYDKKMGRLAFLSIVFAVLIYFIINDLVFKTIIVEFFDTKLRPYILYPDEIVAIGHRFIDSSFPSGHVASSVAVLSVLVYYYKKYWLPAVIFVLFMIFARMHMGMHYPSDVLAGLVLGLIYAFAGVKIAKMILKRK